MSRSSHFVVLACCGLAAACGEGTGPTAANRARTPVDGASATIYDAAHAAPASSGFVFLPPMVKNPGDLGGRDDPALTPVVEVCELTPAGSCGALVERFTATGGSRTSANVRWLGNHYQVDFDARLYSLNPQRRYRVNVLANGLLLGWADVVVGQSAKDFKGIDPESFVTITTAQTLAIKFRIGTGIAARISITPPTQTVKSGEPAQYAASVTDLHGQPLTGGVSWTSSDPTVAQVDANGRVTTLRTGTVTITATSQRVSATAQLVVVPPVARVTVDPVTLSIGKTVLMVAHAYDQAGNEVFGEPISWSVADGN